MIKTLTNSIGNFIDRIDNRTWRIRHAIRLNETQLKFIRGVYFATCFLVCLALSVSCVALAIRLATHIIS